MEKTRIVILGAGYSGLMAARRLAHKTKGRNVEITLVNASDQFVERIRLHQFAANESLKVRPLRDLLERTGIRSIQGWATALDTNQRTVKIKTETGVQSLRYDHLIYALGSFPDTNLVPGIADYTLPVGTEKTAKELRKRLPEVSAHHGRLLIAGGGLTGIEASTELAEADPGLRITLVTSSRFGADLSEDGRKHVRRTFDRLSIDLIDQTRVVAVERDHLKTDAGDVAFDLCLWAGPFTVSSLAREAGLTVNARGQAIVDSHLRSVSHPAIYVVGDAADLSDAVEAPIRMACATALPMGSYAADDLAARLRGKTHRAYDFGYVFRCISLGRHDGLIQFVDADDRPQERILTGWPAAQFKELICRYTVWQLHHDRWMFYTHHPEITERAATAPSTSLAR